MTTSPFLTVDDISAAYTGAEKIVDEICFKLEKGELGCLLGPSGCGKTTILRALSGFQELLSGTIVLDGNVISQPGKHVAPEQRNVGMVFQDHALFPHLTIAQNVGFGLSKLNQSERIARVSTLLDLVGMQDYAGQYPHQLSGGQSQRVALARAIAPRPKLLLMDEPFSNLDAELRESLGYEVRALLKELNITAIMVTHDQQDAFALGDQIGIVSNGHLVQWGDAFSLYHTPRSRFIADFVGDGVFLSGKITDKNTVQTALGELGGDISLMDTSTSKIDVLIRPDDVKHAPEGGLRGRVIRKAFKGAQTLYTIRTESNDSLMSLVPSHINYNVGDDIGVSIEADHLVCFASEANDDSR